MGSDATAESNTIGAMDKVASAAPRAIRSFVKRGGRTTVAQARALADLWPRYGIDPGATALDLDACFGRQAPRVLEIGFGDGESLVHWAERAPDRDFLGLEVHPPGVGHCLLIAAERELCNVRVLSQDAVEVLGQRLGPGSLDEVLIWFPDPWPKKRHHKRRILQPAFLTLLADRLKPAGRVRFATDWQPYAAHALETLTAHPAFANTAADGGYAPRPAERPLTKFERRGLRLGHAVYDLDFVRR